MAEQKKKQKGAPASAGSRHAKIMKYYEMTFAPRKLRRMFHNGASIKMLRAWADKYKTPTGASGIGALIKIGKEFNLNLG